MNRVAVTLMVALAILMAGCSVLTGSSDGEPIGAGEGSTVTGSQAVVTVPPVGRATPDERAEDAEPEGGGADTTAAPDDEPTTDGDGLVWTVVAVERNDVLNVRGDPDVGSPIVGTLAPWATGVDVTSTVEITPDGTWRFVRLDDGTEGWANTRFLVAQPPMLMQSDEDELIERTWSLVDFATSETDVGDGARMFADRALWVGGRGIYGDGATGWNWFPASQIDQPGDWDQVRTFDLGGDFGDYACGRDCEKSLNDFIDFARIDDTSNYIIDDIPGQEARGFLDGALWQAPETLHRVVIDTPTSDPDTLLDWQRIHVVYDWSGGKPEVFLINTHGWTP